jgi:RNA 3'-terminal phosphate cyclase (ATP)
MADQLMLPMALAGGGEFTTFPASAHFNSHAAIIEMFLGRRTSVKSDARKSP